MLQAGQRLLGTLLEVDQAEVEVGVRETGIDLDRPAELLDRIPLASHVGVGGSEIAVGLHAVGMHLDRLLEREDRLLRFPRLIVDAPDVDLRLRHPGIELHAGLEGHDPLVPAAGLHQGHAETIAVLGLARRRGRWPARGPRAPDRRRPRSSCILPWSDQYAARSLLPGRVGVEQLESAGGLIQQPAGASQHRRSRSQSFSPPRIRPSRIVATCW